MVPHGTSNLVAPNKKDEILQENKKANLVIKDRKDISMRDIRQGNQIEPSGGPL